MYNKVVIVAQITNFVTGTKLDQFLLVLGGLFFTLFLNAELLE